MLGESASGWLSRDEWAEPPLSNLWKSALREAERLGAAVARGLFLDRQAEFWLSELSPTSSLRELRARVVDVVAETGDMKTFVLAAGRRWSGHRAGQFVTVEAEIDGVRVRRCYSLSSAPGEPLAITVKRTPGGRMSPWLHERGQPGTVLGLGRPAGDFVIPQPTPPKLLFLSGGSGITPLMAIARDLDRRGETPEVIFLHYARSARDVPFRRELDDLARRRGLRLVFRFEDDRSAPPRFDDDDVRAIAPDLDEREAFACGPPGLLERVEGLWKRFGLEAKLRRERFTPSPVAPRADSATATVAFARSGRAFRISGPGVLLERLERAGARVASGCRIGICGTCRCRKISGAVENLRTGEISSAPDEDVQPCITVPRSDLTLDL